MKYGTFLLLMSISSASAQTISVDSLERNGYQVHVHKRVAKPVVRKVIVRDTIWKERVVLRHDTVRVYSYVERTVAPHYVMLSSPQQSPERSFDNTFTFALVGTGNTNGYEMHFGSTIALGERISFFIGAGCAYNSVLKHTRLDLGGHLVITLLQ